MKFHSQNLKKRVCLRPRLGREYNIRINLTGLVYEGVSWILLAQDRVQLRTCEYENESSGFTKGGDLF